MTTPLVFISYSRKDSQQKDDLLTHLKVLQNAGHIETWSDDRIGPGTDGEQEIAQAIAQTKVAVLLVTASFLTSKFVLQSEVPAFLERQKQLGLIIYPIIAKACAWKNVPWLAKMGIRPKNAQPVWSDGGSHADEDLALIAEEIATLIKTAGPGAEERQSILRFSLVTPTGERYETQASPDTLVAELQTAFLKEWQPAAKAGAVSYAIRHTQQGGDLEPTATLAEAHLRDGGTLYLSQRRLAPSAPVRLTIEDVQGHRYITAVRLDTSVGLLARAFVETLQGAGEVTVEVLTGTVAGLQRRRLRHEVTLYDEHISDGAHLRIVPVTSM